MRFTHANRHCPDHPYDVLKRCDDDFVTAPQPEEQCTEIIKWLQKYREDRQHHLQQQTMSPSPNTSRKTPKRSSSAKTNDENKKRVTSRSMTSTPSGARDTPTSDIATMSPNKAARKGLMCEMDMNAGAGTLLAHSSSLTDITELASVMGSPISAISPIKQKHCRPKVILWKEPIDDIDDDPFNSNSLIELKVNTPPVFAQDPAVHLSPVKKSFNPKKKWLREAWQEDLGARPLEGYGASHPLYKNPSQPDTNNWQMASSSNDSGNSSDAIVNPNQNRPSVLIMGPQNKDRGAF